MTQRQRLAKPAPSAVLIADGGRQSFYVTLDISSTMDYNNPRTKKKKPDPPPPQLPQPTTEITTTSLVTQGNADLSGPPGTPIAETPVPMDIDPALDQPEEEDEDEEEEEKEEDISLPALKDRIQILDLHTGNPLISYQNQIFSCYWTSTLGTDILLTAPVADFSHPILREKPNVSILAASTIKLMGRTAQLATRHSEGEGGQSSTPAPETPTTSGNPTDPEKATPVKIPLGPLPSRARQKQASFLERLIAIKAKKGEKDNVTVYTKKVNQGSGWRSQRKDSEGIEDGEDETTPKKSRRGTGTTGRPRGSKRTAGPRTAKGGLFRDYRPQLWDTPGADIRAGSSLTPSSWDQLERSASDGRETPTIRTASASPLPTDQPVPTATRSTRSLSASASNNASPPPSIPPVQSANGDDISLARRTTPSPSLALALGMGMGLQPAVVTGDSVVSASRAPDTESLQQEQTEGLTSERSASAAEIGTDTLEGSGVAAAGDVEMEDV